MRTASVTVSLKKDKIAIKIKDTVEQEEIIKSLKKKLPELKKLYKEERIPIEVCGKVLKSVEMEEIQNTIKEKIDVKVEFETPKTLGLHSIKKTFSKEIQDSKTKFHKGSLRSGQKIEYEGSLVIIGDVNAGAEVIAEENIVILGNLRGLAHAGAKGNMQAIIAANEIDCPQIRIANVIKDNVNEIQDEENTIKNYAFINEKGEIILE
jgi:septum site-determining protein MinC